MLVRRAHIGHATRIRELISDQRGFSLMELLVAMAAGFVVTGALFSIMDVSLHQSALISDKVQADQLGRTTMTAMIDELHNSCIAPEVTPVKAESSGTELRFVSAYGSKAVLTKASEHRIVWEEESSKNAAKMGTLKDKTYESSGGEWPSFTYPSSPTRTVLIGSDLGPVTSGAETTPIFQYYSYNTESTSSTTTPLGTLKAISLKAGEKLSAAAAETVASVRITFNAFPTDANEKLHRNAEFTSQVAFAFSAPPSETPIEAAPCQ
jgi:Tfp pilus assembly protein PilW